MRLLVSIHDVTPAHSREVRRLWSYCESVGIRPALLVVPNWHGEWPIEDHPGFAAWVRDCARSSDAEIFLHGERHDERDARRTAAEHFRAFGKTDREAEFLTLRYGAARERIARGVTRLRRAGLEPVGFVAPAWLEHDECGRAVRDSGLAISEDAGSVTLHERGRTVPSPVLRWSARTPWRARGSTVVAAVSCALHARDPVLRIALHPGDVSHQGVWRSARDAIERCASARRHVRYGAL